MTVNKHNFFFKCWYFSFGCHLACC